jgi:hypothetical protein
VHPPLPDRERQNLVGADLTGTRLDNVMMIGVLYDESTRWPDGFVPPPEP